MGKNIIYDTVIEYEKYLKKNKYIQRCLWLSFGTVIFDRVNYCSLHTKVYEDNLGKNIIIDTVIEYEKYLKKKFHTKMSIG